MSDTSELNDKQKHEEHEHEEHEHQEHEHEHEDKSATPGNMSPEYNIVEEINSHDASSSKHSEEEDPVESDHLNQNKSLDEMLDKKSQHSSSVRKDADRSNSSSPKLSKRKNSLNISQSADDDSDSAPNFGIKEAKNSELNKSNEGFEDQEIQPSDKDFDDFGDQLKDQGLSKQFDSADEQSKHQDEEMNDNKLNDNKSNDNFSVSQQNADKSMDKVSVIHSAESSPKSSIKSAAISRDNISDGVVAHIESGDEDKGEVEVHTRQESFKKREIKKINKDSEEVTEKLAAEVQRKQIKKNQSFTGRKTEAIIDKPKEEPPKDNLSEKKQENLTLNSFLSLQEQQKDRSCFDKIQNNFPTENKQVLKVANVKVADIPKYTASIHQMETSELLAKQDEYKKMEEEKQSRKIINKQAFDLFMRRKLYNNGVK